MERAIGSFDVTVTPDGKGNFGRLSLAKRFHGDLEGESRGDMLAWGTGEGTGAYVALEEVTGSLGGKRGTFVLAHRGSMVGGAAIVEVTVAPGSGTGELAGLAGTMTIRIDAGKHAYELSYSFEST